MSKKHLAYFAFFFYIITYSANLYAKEAEKKEDYLTMKITPELGLLNGSINEYVFSLNCKNVGNKESELVWDINNVPYFRLTADFDVLKYAYIGIIAKFSFPGSSGVMQDYDWLNSLETLWKHESPYALTNYSCHDNQISKFMDFCVSLGGNIYLPFSIKLTPFIAYEYELLSFDSFDGYRIYKSEKYSPMPFEGKVISYSQELNSILLGFKASFDLIPRTCIFGSFYCSPKLSFIKAMDDHIIRSIAFWDKLDFLWNIQAQLGAQYKFNSNHSAGISAGLQYIPLIQGRTSSKTLGSNNKPIYGKWTTSSADFGGSQRFLWSLSLNYSFSL